MNPAFSTLARVISMKALPVSALVLTVVLAEVLAEVLGLVLALVGAKVSAEAREARANPKIFIFIFDINLLYLMRYRIFRFIIYCNTDG